MRGDDVLYRLPDRLRQALREPFGTVLDGPAFERKLRASPPRVLATVGDVVTASAAAAGAAPRLAVVDYVTLRGPVPADVRARLDALPGERVRVRNEAATVSRALWNAVAAAYKVEAPTVLVVEGEEDLAALPAIALAPEGAVVVYGMPKRGPVWVEVHDAVRQRALAVLAQMHP